LSKRPFHGLSDRDDIMIISCNIFLCDVIPSKVRIPINFVDCGTTYLSQHRTSPPVKSLIFYSFQQQQSENLPTSGLVSGFTIARIFTENYKQHPQLTLLPSTEPVQARTSQNKLPEQATTNNNKQQQATTSNNPWVIVSLLPPHTHSCAG
jgi:hypothetical protein